MKHGPRLKCGTAGTSITTILRWLHVPNIPRYHTARTLDTSQNALHMYTVYIYTFVYIYMYMYIRTHMNTQMNTRVCLHLCVLVFFHKYVCIYKDTQSDQYVGLSLTKKVYLLMANEMARHTETAWKVRTLRHPGRPKASSKLRESKAVPSVMSINICIYRETYKYAHYKKMYIHICVYI